MLAIENLLNQVALLDLLHVRKSRPQVQPKRLRAAADNELGLAFELNLARVLHLLRLL